jgi:hypothetical protein
VLIGSLISNRSEFRVRTQVEDVLEEAQGGSVEQLWNWRLDLIKKGLIYQSNIWFLLTHSCATTPVF